MSCLISKVETHTLSDGSFIVNVFFDCDKVHAVRLTKEHLVSMHTQVEGIKGSLDALVKWHDKQHTKD